MPQLPHAEKVTRPKPTVTPADKLVISASLPIAQTDIQPKLPPARTLIPSKLPGAPEPTIAENAFVLLPIRLATAK